MTAFLTFTTDADVDHLLLTVVMLQFYQPSRTKTAVCSKKRQNASATETMVFVSKVAQFLLTIAYFHKLNFIAPV